MESFTRSCEHYGLALEKDTLVSWAFRCRKGEGVLDHLFWSCEFTRFVWLHFFQEVGILFALRRYIRDMIGEFLLHPTFGEKDRFSMVCWSLCDVMGIALLSWSLSRPHLLCVTFLVMLFSGGCTRGISKL